MPSFINENHYSVHLNGPNGETIIVKSQEIVELSDFYMKYCKRGYLRQLTTHVPPQTRINAVRKDIGINVERQGRKIHVKKITNSIPKPGTLQNVPNAATAKVVGQSKNGNWVEVYKAYAEICDYGIVKDIGIGILTYNRPHALARCIESIKKHTNLSKVTVIVSDDGSDNAQQLALLDKLGQEIIVIKNKTRAGIAGNSNRLLKCLRRFKNCLLLNDDVEVVRSGWEDFYFDHMEKTGFKHFIFRQAGIYGATLGEQVDHKGIKLRVSNSKPQGAVLAISNVVDVGYFDEGFGLYGIEHVEYSERYFKDGHQPTGFYDVSGSDQYFKLNNEQSAVQDRGQLLNRGKAYYDNQKFDRTLKTDDIPGISVVLPIRTFGRVESINTVINNVKGWRYPNIEIVVSEHDEIRVLTNPPVGIKYIFTKAEAPNQLFNKSLAFNLAVKVSTYDKLVLHDADLIADRNYINKVVNCLAEYESCHLGKFVIYLDQNETVKTNNDKQIIPSPTFERLVNYYEGGSLGILKTAYWNIGGFFEAFKGYGNEDTDFYARMVGGTKCLDHRTEAFIHLWHPRVQNWNMHHGANKQLETCLKLKSIDLRILEVKQSNSRYL